MDLKLRLSKKAVDGQSEVLNLLAQGGIFTIKVYRRLVSPNGVDVFLVWLNDL